MSLINFLTAWKIKSLILWLLLSCFALLFSHFLTSFSTFSGGGVAESTSQRPGGEAGDAEDEANRGQSQAEGARETQDPAGATPGVEEQNAGAAGRPAETT